MPKIISPITPWLVQRCKIDSEGQFSYDYMGSNQFERGDQAEALKTLFRGKITLSETTVRAYDGGATVSVYLITQENFDVSAYQPYLQALANDDIGLLEASRFGTAVDFKTTGKRPPFGRILSDCNIWFDFTKRHDGQNIALWTLEKELRDILLAHLKVVTTA